MQQGASTPAHSAPQGGQIFGRRKLRPPGCWEEGAGQLPSAHPRRRATWRQKSPDPSGGHKGATAAARNCLDAARLKAGDAEPWKARAGRSRRCASRLSPFALGAPPQRCMHACDGAICTWPSRMTRTACCKAIKWLQRARRTTRNVLPRCVAILCVALPALLTKPTGVRCWVQASVAVGLAPTPVTRS